MTMMMMSSQFGLEDMEALLWGPSFPMADPMGSALHPDEEEEIASIEGGASPLSSSSSSSSPLPHLSPPPSPPSLLFQGDKAEAEDLLSLPWLSVDGLGHSHTGADDGKEDAFSGMDWMAERVDLSEFDLDSLIGSCSPDESPSSPEDLIASLECHMELDALPTLPTPGDSLLPTLPDDQLQESPSPVTPLYVPDAQEELEIKSEPVSPAPSSPPILPPLSPTFTLDLGSEVDVSECEYKPLVPAALVPVLPRVVLSLSPTRIVLLLAPKEEVAVASSTVTIPTVPDVHSDSDSGVNSTSCSPPLLYTPLPSTASSRPPRSRPYPTPKSSKPSPDSPPPATTTAAGGKMKSYPGGGGGAPPPKEKKLKKMEQNKTAATRYRQKKRVEQDSLAEECAELEKKNHALAEKADSIAKEIQYLKDLLEEVRQAKSRKSSTGICRPSL